MPWETHLPDTGFSGGNRAPERSTMIVDMSYLGCRWFFERRRLAGLEGLSCCCCWRKTGQEQPAPRGSEQLTWPGGSFPLSPINPFTPSLLPPLSGLHTHKAAPSSRPAIEI